MKSTDSILIIPQDENHIPISGITEQNKKKFKEEAQDKYCTTLVEDLGKRFPDLPVIKAFQVFDPSYSDLPTQKKLLHMERSLFLNYLTIIILIRVLFNRNGRAFAH